MYSSMFILNVKKNKLANHPLTEANDDMKINPIKERTFHLPFVVSTINVNVKILQVEQLYCISPTSAMRTQLRIRKPRGLNE